MKGSHGCALGRVGRALGSAAFLIATAASAWAQITGEVVGRVVDGATGEPLIGGLVVVEATNLGNVTRDDGSFFIRDVPVGRHRIVSEYLGYRTVSEEKRILAGQTVSVEFRMPADIIESPGIAVVIEREPIRPDPPRRVYTRRAPPGAGLRVAAGFACSARAVLHGAYIVNGRWQMQASVRGLACREESAERISES